MEIISIPTINTHTRVLKTSKSKLNSTTAEYPRHANLGVVPIDIARLIMLNLPDTEINKLMRLNKWWNKITSTDMHFWRLKTELDYGKSAAVDLSGKGWREVYKEKNLGPWADFVKKTVDDFRLQKMMILGLDKSIWGRTNMFRLQKGEDDAIFKLFNCYPNTSAKIEGCTYILIRATDDVVRMKRGNQVVCIWKTTRALVIGICGLGTSLEKCSNAIGIVAEHMIGEGN